MDHISIIWRLNSSADHLTRSKVLYHPTVIEKKKHDIELCVVAKTSKELECYNEAKAVFGLNKDWKIILFGMTEKQFRPDPKAHNIYFCLIMCTL